MAMGVLVFLLLGERVGHLTQTSHPAGRRRGQDPAGAGTEHLHESIAQSLLELLVRSVFG